jgi:4-diphosphocytidyl-2-C-methyl-D-erythritol kinase
MMEAGPLDLPAPAKLNLFLHVTGRRPDGYHLLETVFELIDLADRVRLSLLQDSRIERQTLLPGIDPESDLTVRAARLLAEVSGCKLGVSIALDKKLPMGGGLGGGSSDAATVLLGLNRLWGLRMDRPTLAALALRLGADVPFFIFGRTAYATGIGEALDSCPQPARAYVLVAPGIAVPTPQVFSDPGLTRDTKPLKIFGLLQGGSEVFLRGRNDLQAVVERRFPEVSAALSALKSLALEIGISPDFARMSGSGSTVFLPVPENLLEAAVEYLGLHAGLSAQARVFAARSVARHPLCDWAFE